MTTQLSNLDISSIKQKFSDIWGDIDPIELGLASAKIDVSVLLCSLLEQAEISRSGLAEKLGWKPSRVTKVLSGDENITIETLFKVCNATGYAFDVVARKPNEAHALQPWQRDELQESLESVSKKLNHNLTRVEAMLETATAINQRMFNMASDWQRAKSGKATNYTQTLASNDAEIEYAARAT